MAKGLRGQRRFVSFGVRGLWEVSTSQRDRTTPRRCLVFGVLVGIAAVLLLGSTPASASHLDLSVIPSDVWIKEPGVRLDFSPDDPPGTVSFHTPFVFRFPDGGLRMYYDITDIGEIRSASSSDGLTWTKEPGARLTGGAHAHVLQAGSAYRMYFETLSPQDSIGSATSVDGLAWTVEPGARLSGGARDPVVVELSSGGYRMYFRSVLDIRSATSPDGVSWNVESGVRVAEAREFGAVRLPDGSIAVYYGQASPAFASIRSARSVDGLSFTLDPGERLVPGPPGSLDAGGVLTTSIVQFPAGTVRMYYAGAPGADVNREARVFSAVSERPAGLPCPFSQGFWKNHPGVWPVESLVLGAETYAKAGLRTILRTPPKGDASLILAHQLIAAKLNVANGSDSAPIEKSIADSDRLLAGFPGRLPYGVKASSRVGQEMTALASELDRYNNGLLTPDCGPLPKADLHVLTPGLVPLTGAALSGMFLGPWRPRLFRQ